MAVRKVSEGVGTWTNKMEFPKDRYLIRCIGEEVELSKASGSVMVVRDWEICHPEPIVVGDRQVSIDGRKFRQYATVKIKNEEGWDTEKSDKAFSRFADELKAMGFDSDEIDDENPPCFAKGKVFAAILYGAKDVARRAPTPDQAKRRQLGDPIKDEEGKEVASYNILLDQILGPSTVEVNRPY